MAAGCPSSANRTKISLSGLVGVAPIDMDVSSLALSALGETGLSLAFSWVGGPAGGSGRNCVSIRKSGLGLGGGRGTSSLAWRDSGLGSSPPTMVFRRPTAGGRQSPRLLHSNRGWFTYTLPESSSLSHRAVPVAPWWPSLHRGCSTLTVQVFLTQERLARGLEPVAEQGCPLGFRPI